MISFAQKHFSLIIAVTLFTGFGLYHLAQFETTDEHFWKYDRINKYYSGLHNGITHNDWHRTRINDKPGITVALIAGIGKLYGPDPESHIDTEGENTHTFYDEKAHKQRPLYDMYHTDMTEKINFSLRLPVLLFNALIILPLVYYLLFALTRNHLITHTTTLCIGMSPILIGISQIINPDAFLWGTASVALLAFANALYNAHAKKFIMIAGIFTGLALLSKYTANLLFLFYPMLFVLYTVYVTHDFTWKKDGVRYARTFLSVFALACALFVFFMPEVIETPRHFLYGTVYSPPLQPIVNAFLDVTHLKDTFYISPTKYKTVPIGISALIIFFCVTLVCPLLCARFLAQKKRFVTYVLNIGVGIMCAILIFSCINAWSGATFFSLDNLKENVRVSGELQFPAFASDPAPLFWAKAVTVQAQNFLFSLPPLLVITLCFLWTLLLTHKISHIRFLPLMYLFSLLPLVFIVGGLAADVFVNVRYSIMLYVPYALLCGFAFYEITQISIMRRHCTKPLMLFCALIILTHAVALWTIKPFYFNYTSSLLPKKYVVTDSWGYGVYEAAQYLNTQDNAQEKVIWTDRRGICQFFVGKCIVSNELYLDHTPIDYFVFSRRGMITKPFRPISAHPHNITRERYYDTNFIAEHSVFTHHIGDRPQNFITIVAVEK